jgi:hypothetical protein
LKLFIYLYVYLTNNKNLANVSDVFATETEIEVNFINGFTTYSLSNWTIDEIYEDVVKQGDLL